MMQQSTFEQVLHYCAATPELVAQFDRLTGANLARKGAPINLMVDDATGKTNEDVAKFVEFVREFVYMPWVMAMVADRADRGVIGGSGDNR
jgi:hypothetical protein